MGQTPYRKVIRQFAKDAMHQAADLFTSGVSERTGKAIGRDERSSRYANVGTEAAIRRGKGVKPGTFLEKFPEGPRELAAAIRKGKGKLFRQIQTAAAAAVESNYGESIQKELDRREAERAEQRRPICPHPQLRPCRYCGVMHKAAKHRSHRLPARSNPFEYGESNWDAILEEKPKRRPAAVEHTCRPNPAKSQAVLLAENEAERRRLMYGGRRTDLLKEKKVFDKERAEAFPLFAPARPQQKLFKDNPRGRVIYTQALRLELKMPNGARRLYVFPRKPKVVAMPGHRVGLAGGDSLRALNGARVTAIVCKRGNKHICDRRCKEVRHVYRHVVTGQTILRVTPGGAIL